MPRSRRLAALALALATFVSSTLSAAESALQLTEALVENFDDNSRGWPNISQGATWTASIQQGALSWENRDPVHAHATRLQLPLSSRRNYEVALEARAAPGGSADGFFGIQWGGASGASEYHVFLVSPAGGYRLETYRSGETTVHAKGALDGIYRERGNNVLSLRKLGAQSAFFVNGVCIHIGPTLEPFGPMCGPFVDASAAAAFDSLRIHYLRGAPEAFEERLAAYHAALGDSSRSFLEVPALSLEALAASIALASNPAAPEAIEGWIGEARALVLAGKPAQAAHKLREALASSPENADAQMLYGWRALLMGDLQTARRHARFAKLFDPLAPAARALDACVSAAEGKSAEATQALRLSLFLNGGDDVLADYEKDLDQLAAANVAPEAIAALRAELPALHRARSRAFRPFAAALAEGDAAAFAGDAETAAAPYARIRESMSSLPDEYAWLATTLLARAGSGLFNTPGFREARPYLEAALASADARRDTTSEYTCALVVEQLAQLYLNIGEAANALALGEAQLQATLALPAPAEYRKLELLATLCQAANTLERAEVLRGHANALLGRALSLGSLWYEANALNFLGVSYWATRLPPDRQRMRELLEQAAQKAKAGGFDLLGESILANLAVSYYQSGDKAKAKQTYQTLADQAAGDARPLDAELHLNNYGAMRMMDREYADAAEAFQRAVDIIEQQRDAVSGEERIRFLERRRGNYQFLAQCQALAGQSEALFRTQNAIRARVLAEELLLDAPPVQQSLAAFQSTLAADEAALFYTLNGACNVVIHVVTRESARPVYVELYEPFVELKRNYLDQLRRNRPGYKPIGYTAHAGGSAYSDNNLATQVSREDFDQILETGRGLIDESVKAPPELRRQAIHDTLVAFNELLFSPIQRSLAGKSKLLLFPDDVLYFLPFEALPMANGRYLAEDYEVRYAQSAEVRQILRQRAYPDDRKPFFAMGGAIYEEMSETAEPVSGEARHVQLKIQAAANAVAGRPQREVYAALFSGAMSYLQGTLIEVMNLSRIFPQSTVFIGEDMTENRLKAMSESGELAQYKIVHLATHGFALPEFPQLSGLAMCIFEEMQGGEDGYLTAPEIARLKMQADLAVLSACQTGLGRIYGGEGIAGLTSSILVGGANRALVTLWPVSDAGTMRYMTGLYELVTQGIPLPEASARMKRRFIAGEFGEEFRDPYIWAPFVLYGP